jgi:hypothetical protein
MARSNRFAHGDLVSGKKWNGEHFLGVYEHEYDCGDHLIFDGNKQFCIHKRDCHHANEEEANIIKETILKTMKENEKISKKKKETKIEKELSQEELEELFTEE